MRWPIYCVSSVLLAACAAQVPIVQTRTVTVRVPVYVALPSVLTTTIPDPMPAAGPITNQDLFDLAIQRGAAVDRLNSQVNAIRKLQPRPLK